jgi:hypothetical protein
MRKTKMHTHTHYTRTYEGHTFVQPFEDSIAQQKELTQAEAKKWITKWNRNMQHSPSRNHYALLEDDCYTPRLKGLE